MSVVNTLTPVPLSKGQVEGSKEQFEDSKGRVEDLVNALLADLATEPPPPYESHDWNAISDEEKNRRLEQRRKDEVERVMKVDAKSPIAVLAIPSSDKFTERVEFLKKILDPTVNKNDGAEEALESKCISLCIA
jgi:hypothetical protein